MSMATGQLCGIWFSYVLAMTVKHKHRIKGGDSPDNLMQERTTCIMALKYTNSFHLAK